MGLADAGPSALVVRRGHRAKYGAFNAALVTGLRIPSFIVTLGTGQLIFGLTLLVTDTQTFNPATRRLDTVSQEEVDFFFGLSNQDLPFRFPMQGLWMVAVAIVVGILLSRPCSDSASRPSAAIPSLHSSPGSRSQVQVRGVHRLRGPGGPGGDARLLVHRLDPAEPEHEPPVPGLRGGHHRRRQLAGGRGTAIGTLSGALLLAVIANGLALNSAGPFLSNLVAGTVMIAAVVLDRLRLAAEMTAPGIVQPTPGTEAAPAGACVIRGLRK